MGNQQNQGKANIDKNRTHSQYIFSLARYQIPKPKTIAISTARVTTTVTATAPTPATAQVPATAPTPAQNTDRKYRVHLVSFPKYLPSMD